ncbi:MAG: hypothetical protein ACNA8P_04625, partial [Phycisphaerales bacterium]
MGRSSRASKGRGPTRRERRAAAQTSGRQPQRTTPAPPPRPRRAARVRTRRLWKRLAKRRILSSAIVALAALCTLAIGVGWWLASQPPGWWAEIDTEAPETIATSRDVENWAISTMTQGRTGNGLWAVTLTEDDANTWLAIRLPMWVISEHGKWPDGIHCVRVRFADDRIIIGADIRDPDSPTPRVIAAALKLHFNDSGAVRAQIEWTQFNRLKLPGAAG